MAAVSQSHPYRDRTAFERLMLLIATLAHRPGIGHPATTGENDFPHNAMQALHAGLQEMAQALELDLPVYAPATLRKDLIALRHYGVLGKQMYRWGYYLGGCGLTSTELKLALDAIASLAQNQADPQARSCYHTLVQRFKSLDQQQQGALFYPVRQILNKATNETDPAEMMAKGENQNSLFHQLDQLEKAVLAGQAVELSRREDLYSSQRVGPEKVWPLQLVYYDVAWYLLYEECQTGHFATGRLNRFANYCRALSGATRDRSTQRQQLAVAQALLRSGWGLYLGEKADQKAELEKTLPLEPVKIRFFEPVTRLILEGSLRHPRQQIIKGPTSEAGRLQYIDYTVHLPPRSLNECLRWVNRYLPDAQVIGPSTLAKHQQALVQQMAARYHVPL